MPDFGLCILDYYSLPSSPLFNAASQKDGSLPQWVIRWFYYICASIRAIRPLKTAVKNFYGDYCLPLYPMAQSLMLQGFERGGGFFILTPLTTQ